MRSWSFLAVALAVGVLLAGSVAVVAYDHAQRETIADGIQIAGIHVGGLSAAQARAKLRAQYAARTRQPIFLRYGHRTFTLTPRAAQVRLNLDGAVQQAVQRTRADNLPSRVWRSLTGASINDQIQPQLAYSQAAVNRLVGRVSRELDQPARDASISYSGASISPVNSQTGLAVNAPVLSAALDRDLAAGITQTHITVPVARTLPRVSTAQLAARYATVITVDRGAFRLRLWKHLALAKTYTIAVGMVGLQTPAGLYHVQDKEVDPSWHVPNSSWAGALAGQTIPPGPQDPLKARWMGIYNGAGIHGTDELSSLGSAASHGCIRMAIPDVIDLYDQTPLGTPVYIA